MLRGLPRDKGGQVVFRTAKSAIQRVLRQACITCTPWCSWYQGTTVPMLLRAHTTYRLDEWPRLLCSFSRRLCLLVYACFLRIMVRTKKVNYAAIMPQYASCHLTKKTILRSFMFVTKQEYAQNRGINRRGVSSRKVTTGAPSLAAACAIPICLSSVALSRPAK